MKHLEQSLEYQFQDRTYLHRALIHSSYANEHKGSALSSNERLEFLGDSVLSLVVSEYLFSKYPRMPEGELTRMRANLVREESLFAIAKAWGIGPYLLLGKGEGSSGGRERPSILADAVEAILAAIYLDGGIEAARSVIGRHILERESPPFLSVDHKTTLQEIVQRDGMKEIHYVLTAESGPDHEKTFQISVFVEGKLSGIGSGKSKKSAEQAAAYSALQKFFSKNLNG